MVVSGLGGGGPNTPETAVLGANDRETGTGTEATRLLGAAERAVVLVYLD